MIGDGAQGAKILQVFTLDREQFVPRPVDEVFAFFSDAGNLDRITPPWLSFRIVTPRPIDMRTGAVIDYRLRYHGMPVRWKTLIEAWEPGKRFIDRALKSPYALWRHTHTFRAAEDGTVIRDYVEYALPLGPLGWLAHKVLVRRDVEAIFDHRQAVIAEIFVRTYCAGAPQSATEERAPGGSQVTPAQSPDSSPGS